MRNYTLSQKNGAIPMIHEEENKLLLAPFEEQEILESIKACAGDKAPGPDGYGFLQPMLGHH